MKLLPSGRTAVGLSFYNPVERMHARANQGLQGIGLMRKSMEGDLEKVMKKCNYNDEVRGAYEKEPRLAVTLKESLHTIIELLRETFLRLSMTRTEFKLFDPESKDELEALAKYYDIFDEGIRNLTSKSNLNKFPVFKTFLETHTSSRTYSFHIFKCGAESCIYHSPLRGSAPEPFPDPVPVTNADKSDCSYEEGLDPSEKNLPSKLEDVMKQNHNVPFTPTAQTAKNVGYIIPCNECGKPRLLHSKNKLKPNELNSFKRFINDFVYVCGGTLREIAENEGDIDSFIKDKVFFRENIACSTPYYSVGTYKNVCIHCGCDDLLIVSQTNYPKCIRSDKPDVMRKKRKSISSEECQGSKQRKLV